MSEGDQQVQNLGALARGIESARDDLDRLRAVVEHATRVVSGSDWASIAVLHRGRLVTEVASQPTAAAPAVAEPVTVVRSGDTLTVALNRPERHNAFGRQVRDGLVDAFDLAAADDSIARVRLVGTGPSFCSVRLVSVIWLPKSEPSTVIWPLVSDGAVLS